MPMPEYINKQYLNTRLQDFADWCRDNRKQGVDFVLECVIPNAPTGDVAPVLHAHWFTYKHAMGKVYQCSNCTEVVNQKWFYCPYCGAKMDEEVNK